MELDTAVRALIYFVPVLFTITIHETAHGFMAYKLGDTTAYDAGRLSLNPVRHIDPVGTILLPMILVVTGAPVFGWAKPVPFNPQRFRQTVDARKGIMLVAAAGPLSNFIFAFISSFFYIGFFKYTGESVATLVFQALVIINISLGMFNLVPVPPLDGSKLLYGIIPQKYINFLLRYERYGFFVLLLLIVTDAIDVLFYPINWVLSLFITIPAVLFSIG